jgi:hypothetical protein
MAKGVGGDWHLKLHVFVTPEIPVVTPDLAPGLSQRMWSPTTSTLICGERDAVLVGSLLTIKQATALVTRAP